jgi:hypothetical protein
MTTITPVRLSPDATGLDTATPDDPAPAAATPNADTPAAPGSGLSGLIALFANKSTPDAGRGSFNDLWLSHVKIPPLDSILDDEDE